MHAPRDELERLETFYANESAVRITTSSTRILLVRNFTGGLLSLATIEINIMHNELYKCIYLNIQSFNAMGFSIIPKH